MKIPFKQQEMENMDSKTYKTKFKAAVKKLKTKVNSPETATHVFINQAHRFADGEEGVLLLFGELNGPWKQYAKDAIKADKKMTLIGKGYVETDQEGNNVFKFINVKGNAKIDKVTKAAKAILRMSKLGLNLVESLMGTAPTSPESQDSQQNETSAELAPELLAHKQKMEARMAKMDEQLDKLMAKFKLA